MSQDVTPPEQAMQDWKTLQEALNNSLQQGQDSKTGIYRA